MKLAETERIRAQGRLATLPRNSLLWKYENCYGLELGRRAEHRNIAAWGSNLAFQPYPASVRARRLAVAISGGAEGLEGHLARAARAVLLQPELHLLGNHLLENAIALACAGAVTVGSEADVWWRAGTWMLTSQLPQQFLTDGGHFERSASYHWALTGALLELIALAGSSGRRAPLRVLEIAESALAWGVAAMAPDETYPLFNDAALDAAPSPSQLLEFARTLGIRCPPRAAAEGTVEARHLSQTGWVIAQVPNDSWLALDAGPDGASYQPGHVHADSLTIELWVKGKRTIVDFGVASYAPGELRRLTRATASHNTIELAGYDSSEVWGGFRVGRRARGQVNKISLSNDTVTIECSHDGYAWLPGSPVHRREIVLKRGELTIRDRIEGSELLYCSRQRVLESDAHALNVEGGPGPLTTVQGLWYPRHGVGERAQVYELRSVVPGQSTWWRFRW